MDRDSGSSSYSYFLFSHSERIVDTNQIKLESFSVLQEHLSEFVAFSRPSSFYADMSRTKVTRNSIVVSKKSKQNHILNLFLTRF